MTRISLFKARGLAGLLVLVDLALPTRVYSWGVAEGGVVEGGVFEGGVFEGGCYEHVLAYGLRLECEALRELYTRITVTCESLDYNSKLLIYTIP